MLESNKKENYVEVNIEQKSECRILQHKNCLMKKTNITGTVKYFRSANYIYGYLPDDEFSPLDTMV